ncbi:MAG: hypothetical protein ACOCP7_01815 [Desulfohalobiaceae bacterium]
MTCYRLTSRLVSPFMIQRSRQTFTPQTVDYLAGSTLRGALAGLHLRTGGHAEDPGFQSLFGPKGPNFPDLQPVSDPGLDASVLPLTAVSCKRFPGFAADGGHGVRDSLAMTALNRQTGQGVPEFWKCPVCGHTCVPFSGYYVPDQHTKEQPTVVLQRHTGIDRATGTVAQRIFYASQVLREEDQSGNPQYFAGRIFADETQYQALQELLARGPLFAGADRVRGLGEMEVSVQEGDPVEVDAGAWSQAWTDYYTRTIGQEPAPGIYFSIILTSPAVLVDRFLRPSAELYLDFPDLTLVGKVAKKTTVRGWQLAWGLPKPDDTALAAGSTFLFRYQGQDISGLNKYLTQLARQGIGLRRQEGLGGVSICDPVHYKEGI